MPRVKDPNSLTPTEYRILAAIVEIRTGTGMDVQRAAYSVSKGGIYNMLNKLVARGLIDKSNQATPLYSITENGAKTFAGVELSGCFAPVKVVPIKTTDKYTPDPWLTHAKI